MKSKFIEREFAYDGTQLRSLFAYLDHGLMGNSIVAWVGPCEVSFDHMVDGEDLLAKSAIRGSRMVHFIVEKFGAGLPEMVALQRLLAGIVVETLSDAPLGARLPLRREGDDVFATFPLDAGGGEGKLSISIATVSPTSGLIHFAVNVSNEGTPVKTASLEDLRVPAQEFAERVLSAFSSECASIEEATQKVKWVR